MIKAGLTLLILNCVLLCLTLLNWSPLCSPVSNCAQFSSTVLYYAQLYSNIQQCSVANTDSQGSRQVSHRSLTALPYLNKKPVKATKMKRIKSRNKALANPIFIAHTVHIDLLMWVQKMLEMITLKMVSIKTQIKT